MCHPNDRPKLTKGLTLHYLEKWEKDKRASPQTQWYYEEDGKFIAVDNRSHDFFMEEFDSLEECFAYLSNDDYFIS